MLNKLFGERPKKASAPQAHGSRPLRKVEVVDAAMAEKKSVVAKKAKTAGRAVLNKRPRQEAEPAVEPPPPAKRVKKVAEKRAREIHVISNQTTGATTPSVSPSPAVDQPLVEKQPTPTAEIVQAQPISRAGTPVVPPSVEAAPVLEKAVSATEGTSPVNPKPSIFILEKSEGSDKAPLANRPHTRRQPPPVSEMVVQAGPSTADRGKRLVEEPETAVPVSPSTADRGKRPAEEPEATVKMPVHPQDQDLHIPPQEATLAFWPSNVDNLHRLRELRSNLRHWARPLSSLGSSNGPGDMAEVSSRQVSWEVEFKALISSTTAGSGPSAAMTEAADPTALTQLREVLSLSAS
ncbi:unnamed protein product [Malus baccata var. baccata]